MNYKFLVPGLFCFILVACDQTESDIPVVTNSTEKTQEVSKLDSTIFIDPCDFVYDTITDYTYSMHLAIMEKFNHEEKRGYVYGPNGDTVNHFLYHQDIVAFISKLDSTETGIYKMFTNKVIYVIIENDPKMLDYGLTLGPKNGNRLDYFMEHVAHPSCHNLPIKDIITIVQQNMTTHNGAAKRVKERLIENLEFGKS